MAETMEILLVRHGESEANHTNTLISDAGDPGLTATGVREAEHLAQLWHHVEFTAVYSSPLRRTRQTAEAFLRPGQTLRVDERLHEIHLGAFDGKRIPDLLAQDTERYRRWKENPEAPPSGGERLSEVAERIQAWLGTLVGHERGMILAATHADCLKAVTLLILGAPYQSAGRLHFDNVAGVHLVYQAGEFQIVGLPPAPPVAGLIH